MLLSEELFGKRQREVCKSRLRGDLFYIWFTYHKISGRRETMTIIEARQIIREYYDNTNPTGEDKFLCVEAMSYLIEETKDPSFMNSLGAFYYEDRQFDLACKYYEMAAEYNDLHATSNLGYIWYYGRTGERNYEKAYYYFNKAREMGDLVAAYKVADMYKNGYYVEKDYDKYKEIIEELYPQVKDARWTNEPLPEIYTRLARIRAEEGKTDEALRLYDEARAFLAWRIQYHPFFGDLNIMKWMIEDIYRLREFNAEGFSLYDLFYLLQKPVRVRFRFEDQFMEVEMTEEDGEPGIRFGEIWYHTVEDFFQKAEIKGELMTMRYRELYDFEVI